MKIWPIIYILLIPFTIFTGFHSLRPEDTAGTNPDWVLVIVTFIACSFFPLAAVAFGLNYTKKDSIQKPTWDRHPIGWWTDTLQSLRFTLVYLSLYALGAVFAFQRADENGRMMFFFILSMPVGLFLGERLVYAIYRNKIRA